MKSNDLEDFDDLQEHARDLAKAALALDKAITTLQKKRSPANDQSFIDATTELDEQINKTRFMMVLATIPVTLDDDGRKLTLSQSLMENREEFDAFLKQQMGKFYEEHLKDISPP